MFSPSVDPFFGNPFGQAPLAQSHGNHALGECMVCKAKRLQEEANEEFRRRYPLIVLRPGGMAGYWR